MKFVPAGEYIGDKHQIRSVRIEQSPHIPDGEYGFVDTYCIDPECDCRKTMIQVIHEDKLVSIINYGWESKSFYDKWMGEEITEPHAAMSGASVDISSPNLVEENAIIALFNTLLNEKWIEKFKTHYRQVKIAVSN